MTPLAWSISFVVILGVCLVGSRIDLSRARRRAPQLVHRWLALAKLGPEPEGELGRRRERRWALQREVSATIGETTHQATIFNVSPSGMELRVNATIAAGQAIRVAECSAEMCVEGKIVAVSGPDESGRYIAHVQFDPLPDEPESKKKRRSKN